MLHGLIWLHGMSTNVCECIKYFAEVPITHLRVFMKPLYPPILSNDMQYGNFHKLYINAKFVKIISQEYFVCIWYYEYVYMYTNMNSKDTNYKRSPSTISVVVCVWWVAVNYIHCIIVVL